MTPNGQIANPLDKAANREPFLANLNYRASNADPIRNPDHHHRNRSIQRLVSNFRPFDHFDLTLWERNRNAVVRKRVP